MTRTEKWVGSWLSQCYLSDLSDFYHKKFRNEVNIGTDMFGIDKIFRTRCDLYHKIFRTEINIGIDMFGTLGKICIDEPNIQGTESIMFTKDQRSELPQYLMATLASSNE